MLFLTFGNVTKTAEAANIPQRTLYDWTKTEWWAELITRFREEKKHELDANLSRIVNKCTQTIENKLENDEVSARDAAMIMGITFDKRQVLNNQPTSISGKSIDISALQGKFEEFLQTKTIEGERVDSDVKD